MIVEYTVTALLSGCNAAYFLWRRWRTRRLRAGAWTLALVSLGVCLQGVYVALAAVDRRPLDAAELKGWLLAGSLGLAGSLLVAFLALRHGLRR